MVDTRGPDNALEAIRRAEALVAHGQDRDAIRVLMAANRTQPNAAIERRLVDIRHAAFARQPNRPGATLPAPVTASMHTPGPLRSLTPAELSLSKLRNGLAEHGCVLVRGLVTPERAAVLAKGIDRALAGFDESETAPAGSTEPWYRQFTPGPGYQVVGRRNWVRASGAVWTVDSPHMLFELTELAETTGIIDLITAYLSERPALSANKCTLRRVPIDTATNWHQDGAFLGAEVRTLNLWLALSAVDDDSPGLEILPRRLDTLLPTGTEGAMFDWSVSPAIVEQQAAATPVVCPDFSPGDALLFDHLFLHRTRAGPGMTRERYAMENWFFAPSSYPEGQIPIAL